jgi:glutathione S-transferase fosA
VTSGVNHITFAVSDVHRSVDFYVNVLGCEKAAVWRQGAYLRAGSMWICLSLDSAASRSAERDYTHIAFTFGKAELAAFRARLLAAGGAEWKTNSSEGDSVYFLDPDGHRLEAHVGDLESRLASLKDAPYAGLTIFGDSDDSAHRCGRAVERGARHKTTGCSGP